MKVRHDNISISKPVNWDLIREENIIFSENGYVIIEYNYDDSDSLIKSLCFDIAEDKDWMLYNKNDVKLSFFVRKINKKLNVFIEVQIKPALWEQLDKENIVKAINYENDHGSKAFCLKEFEESDKFYSSPHEYESKYYQVLPTQNESKKFSYLYEQHIHM